MHTNTKQPKPKGFARIRAALQEESAPVDSDAKREAEVIRQVQATYTNFNGAPVAPIPQSPGLYAGALTSQNETSELSDVDALGMKLDSTANPNPITDERRRSVGRDFQPNLYNRQQTPEAPPLFWRGRSSTGLSEDMGIDSPAGSTPQSSVASLADVQPLEPRAEIVTAQVSQLQTPTLPSATDLLRKVKRRRDEEFDPASIKRRAVSPGLSTQSSPLPTQSSASTPVVTSGPLKSATRENSTFSATSEDMSTSSNSYGPPTPAGGTKRMGLQGMTDTSDGLMKMVLQ